MHSKADISRGFQQDDATEPQRLGVARLVLLAIWVVASFGICFFARDLHRGGQAQPLAYAVAGQGLLILFILIVVVNAVIFRNTGESEAPAADEAGPGV